MPARILDAVRRILPQVLITQPVPGAHAQTITIAPIGDPINGTIKVTNATPLLMTIGGIQPGQLLFYSVRHGKCAPAPLIATKVKIDISGMFARRMVKQYFVDPTQE